MEKKEKEQPPTYTNDIHESFQLAFADSTEALAE
jgi:hypothetical protein